jgi:hypothetical protein
MQTPSRWSRWKYLAFILLLLSGGSVAAQTADQSFKTIPQQVKTSAETKATTKTNTVSNDAMNKLDSASNKAFKGFTGLFKKKPKPTTPPKPTPLKSIRRIAPPLPNHKFFIKSIITY